MSDLLDRLEDATVEELDEAIDRAISRVEVLTAARAARFGADMRRVTARARRERQAAATRAQRHMAEPVVQ